MTLPKYECELPGGECYEMPDVGCEYHGLRALDNGTGYYAKDSLPKPIPRGRESHNDDGSSSSTVPGKVSL